MIEIFKTNVNKKREAKLIIKKLLNILPDSCINFDLEDCDRILRIENKVQNFDTQNIITVLNNKGFYCEILKD